MGQDREGIRRTGQTRTKGRSALVVERVFAATLDELCRVGYAAMRVEDVAALSGVNKTTIYRRWPTKVELVGATLGERCTQRRVVVDTGSLRGDLRSTLLGAFELGPAEQAVLRIMQMERSIPEFGQLVNRFREEFYAMRLEMVKRGIARGELPSGTDACMVVDLLSAPIQRAMLFNEQLEGAYVDRMLDVVLAGAAAVAKAPSVAHSAARKGRRVHPRASATAAHKRVKKGG